MANYVPYVTASAGSTNKNSSYNPYDRQASTQASTQASSSYNPYESKASSATTASDYNPYASSSTPSATPASEYNPYAKYDNKASATTTATTTSGYSNNHSTTTSSTTAGYNSYGTATGNTSSAIPASDYDPYAKYQNTSSSTTTTTTSLAASNPTTVQASSSSAASSGYDAYGNNAAVPSSDYDPYAKYNNTPSAPTAPAVGTIPAGAAVAAVPSSSQPSSDGFASGFQNPGGSTPSPIQGTVTAVPQQPLYIQVTVPQGVSSGQTIEVRAPDGRAKQVVVPPGLGPGSPLTVEFDNNSTNTTLPAATAPGKPNTKNSLEAKATKTMNSLVNKMGKMGIKVPGVAPTSSASSSQPVLQTTNVPAPSVGNPHFAPIAPQHATSQPTELFLKEKTMSWTGDDAKIKDANNNVIFKIKAELLTFSQSRTLTDAHGNALGVLRHKMLDFAPTIYIGPPANEKKVSIKTSGMFNPFNCNASISVDGVKVGKAQGNWRAKKFSITIDGVEVATIGRKTTMAAVFMDADSYKISITPQGQPVDLAFISLICIALDELYHDK